MTLVASCRAAIVGLAGPVLLPEERALLAELPPAGIILFQRNCQDRAQVRALVDALVALAPGRRLAVLIDQEGGRVMRLRPPHWRPLPAPGTIGGLAEYEPSLGAEAAWLLGRLIAHDLREIGINVDCAPLLDVAGEGMTAAIGDRSFGRDPRRVAELGGRFMAGLMAGGVAPVIKHVPGHGRARIDSHVGLPCVDAPLEALRTVDFVPFAALHTSPFAMTAHVVFTALDPERPATTSAGVISKVIRGELGFQGLLMSDDLAMGALSHDPASRARAALAAGCDLALYCPGCLNENRAVLEAVPFLPEAALARLQLILAHHDERIEPFDPDQAEARLAELLGGLTV